MHTPLIPHFSLIKRPLTKPRRVEQRRGADEKDVKCAFVKDKGIAV